MSQLRILLLTVALTLSAHAELPVIADAAHDPAWSALFASLSLDKPRTSLFEERRHFPFRSKPVVLTGEIRLAPDRGLSLHYLTPKTNTLIVDRKGLLMRDAKGRNQSAPDDPRAQAAMGATVNILHFNLPELQKSFILHGERHEAAWSLVFEPRDESLARSLGSLTVSGEAQLVKKIVIARSEKQRIEILIRETHEDVVFTEAELTRYFR